MVKTLPSSRLIRSSELRIPPQKHLPQTNKKLQTHFSLFISFACKQGAIEFPKFAEITRPDGAGVARRAPAAGAGFGSRFFLGSLSVKFQMFPFFLNEVEYAEICAFTNYVHFQCELEKLDVGS